MPPASDILLGLARAATDHVGVSIAWHLALAATVATWVLGFRPQKRLASAILSAPLASVAIVAFDSGNPFNGAIFALLSLALAVLALHSGAGAVGLRSDWSGVLGFVLIAFGAFYPHFLRGASWFTYLYAAPLGAIPCPTLSVVIGAALAAGGFGIGPWRLTLGAAGLCYGAFGVLRLGVRMDVLLFVGAAGLLVQYLQEHSHARTGEGTASV